MSATQALKTANEINVLFEKDVKKIETLGRARFSCLQTLEYLTKLPHISAQSLSAELGFSTPTARNSLNHLVSLGILEETSHKQRDKVYVYRKYLDILEEGAEPL